MGPEHACGLLIVEDDEGYRHALERAAVRRGYTPFGCETWADVDADLAYEPRLAGALIDLQLPQGTPNGLSVGHMIHHRQAKLKLVFMSVDPDLGHFVPDDLGPVIDKQLGIEAILANLAA